MRDAIEPPKVVISEDMLRDGDPAFVVKSILDAIDRGARAIEIQRHGKDLYFEQPAVRHTVVDYAHPVKAYWYDETDFQTLAEPNPNSVR